MTRSILSYLFSLIGFVPIDELQSLQQQQPQQQKRRITTVEESCQYLSSSTFVIQEEQDDYNEKNNSSNSQMQDWLLNLSKMALCQILTSTIADYPQVADGIYNRHYEKNYYINKNKNKSSSSAMDDLISLRSQVKQVAHSLDNLRPSDQFGRASEVANGLYRLLHCIEIQQHNHSFISLFGLIILAQESLDCPSEVRQHIFGGDVKFGRAIILEMSKILKNFNQFGAKEEFNYKWSLLSTQMNWFDSLQFVCTKLARYDITWEYRKEYQEVIMISERYTTSTTTKLLK